MIRVLSIETNITLACQNRCVGCNHFSPILPADPIEPAQLQHDIDCIKSFVHCKFYRLVGGEPTLHPDIVEICHIVKASGICDHFQVWSNGMNLRRMPGEFWRSFDEMIFSCYPGKVSGEDRAWMETVCRQNGTKFTTLDKHLFRLPFHRTTATRELALHRYAGCPDCQCHQTMAMDRGFFFLCSSGPFIPKMVLGLPFGTDGIRVESLTEITLQAYLDNPEPLQGCYRCDGYQGARINWHETTKENWLKESMYDD